MRDTLITLFTTCTHFHEPYSHNHPYHLFPRYTQTLSSPYHRSVSLSLQLLLGYLISVIITYSY